MIRELTMPEQANTLRVQVDGISAIALTHAYARHKHAQDEIVTILAYLCREKGIEPAQVVGFDDDHGELVVRA